MGETDAAGPQRTQRRYRGKTSGAANRAYEADAEQATRAGWQTLRLAWDKQASEPTLVVEYVWVGRADAPVPNASERILRTQKLILEKGFISSIPGWLILTDQRLVFSREADLLEAEVWAVPLEGVESAVADESVGWGMHKLTVHFRDDDGEQQRQVFNHANISKGLILGPFSHQGDNPLTSLERQVQDAVTARREALTAGRAAGGPPSVSTLAGELERLEEMRDRGSITEAEFQTAKARVLGSG